MGFNGKTDHVSSTDGATDAHLLLAAKNPEAAKLVEAIKISTHAPSPDMASTDDPTSHYVPKGPPTRALTKGEMRLTQAYLRMMEYFGPISSVRGIDVAHGRLDTRTKNALKTFTDTHGKTYDLHSPHPTKKLLAAVIEEHDVFHQKQLSSHLKTHPVSPLEHEAARVWRGNLNRAFEEKKAAFGSHYDKIKTLHPEMRFPVLVAIQDLKNKHGIDVVIYETFRTPDKQTGHILRGESTAPPGYSFHSYGLALDIYPKDAHGKRIMNTKDPKWKTLNEVMTQHGFYSMHLVQGWDAPHHELPAKTGEMLYWPKGSDGWKDIPRDVRPKEWLDINRNTLLQEEPLHSRPPARIGRPSPRQK